ncbi:MAG: response regulator transcription factor [Arcobacteraceae bacterium]
MDSKLIETLKDISILCVEDENGIRNSVVETLKYYFKEVYEAKNGEEAYELYLDYKPKIILTDIDMPISNGVELVKKIRENDTKVMIIMLTAYSNEEYLLDLINLNINQFILKPLNSKKLSDALEKYISINFSEEILLPSNLKLNLLKRQLVYNENEFIDLRKREADFLNILYKNNQKITTYEEIEDELWQDKYMTTHALKSFIKELRSKLPVNIIKNISQMGYILETS